jgi:hypothetical protein
MHPLNSRVVRNSETASRRWMNCYIKTIGALREDSGEVERRFRREAERHSGMTRSVNTTAFAGVISQNRDWGLNGETAWNGMIDNLDGAGYSRGSALTGRLLPAAREASHLFRFPSAVTFFQPGISGTPANMKGGRVTASKFLPSHPSFESIRKQAKKLVRQFAVGDPDSVARVHAQLPAPILPLSLRDAQFALARVPASATSSFAQRPFRSSPSAISSCLRLVGDSSHRITHDLHQKAARALTATKSLACDDPFSFHRMSLRRLRSSSVQWACSNMFLSVFGGKVSEDL